MIKIPKSKPIPMNNQTIDDMQSMNSDVNDPNTMIGDMQQPQINDGTIGNEEGFDAGVEADKETDPKKYIQQLSGKLSQELRSYNQDQNTPDTDLNKYVAGMVIPQATKAMTNDDKKDVIDKINKGVTDDDMDDETAQMESTINLDNIINEIIGSVINQEIDDGNRKEKKITNKKVTNKNPFISNR